VWGEWDLNVSPYDAMIYIVRRYDSRQTPDYRALAEFRSQIRGFLKTSEEAARSVGLEPQQHQLLLAIKGLPDTDQPTVGRVAERLQLKHHSAVELVDRCERQGLARREHDETDHRRVLVHLTDAGEELLRRLSEVHEEELTQLAPHLTAALEAILRSRGVAA
jgi:DNA-binding MarR family transcriptional regulator